MLTPPLHSVSVCGSSSIRSAAGDIEGDIRSTLPWEYTWDGTYSGGIVPGGDTHIVIAPSGRGNNTDTVCRNGDDTLAQKLEE
jgi:hypothetical protein